MLRIVIGMTNYSGVACGLNFESSIAQNVPKDWTIEEPQVKRLLALFPGTTVETVGENDAKVKADLEAARKADHAARAVAEAKAKDAAPEAEAVEEEVEEEVEEVEEEVEKEVVGESVQERIERLVDENSKDELIEKATEIGATHAAKATKTEIAREIVEKQDA